MSKIHLLREASSRLSLTKSNKNSVLLPALHHFDLDTGKTRQKRSDRRANIFKVLEVIIPELEVSNLSWGRYYTRHDGVTDFYNQGIEYICAKTGMNERTVVRVFEDLTSSGYMKTKHCSGINTQKEKIRYNSIRTMTNKFFVELGFKSSRIEKDKSWKLKQIEKKYANQKISDKCKFNKSKIQTLFNKHSTKNVSKPACKKPQKISSYDTTNLLHKASEIASSTGRNPMEIYRELINSI